MKKYPILTVLLLLLAACSSKGAAPAVTDTPFSEPAAASTASSPTSIPTATQMPSATHSATATQPPTPSATATIAASPTSAGTPGITVFVNGDGGDVFTAEDNLIHSGAPDINFGGHDVYDVSTSRRFLQRFDLSLIPKDVTLVSARVYYYKASAVPNNDVTVTLYSISQENGDWREGGEYGGEGKPGDSTWDLKDAAGVPWAGSPGLSTPGVDYEVKPIGSFVIPARAQVGEEYVCDLDLERVAGWLGTPNTNYGILMVANGAAEYIGSAENETPGLRPKLVVEYTSNR